MAWLCADRSLDPEPRPLVMGVLNVTPDSFSDGGRFTSPDTALEAARQIVADGADVIDVGGESSRPGAHPVPEEEELRRIVPVLERLAPECPIPISIDTCKPAVARRALQLGAKIVNDVGAASDPEMVRVLSESDCGYVLMHRKGTPANMQTHPSYDDAVAEICDFLARHVDYLSRNGVGTGRIAIDPGFGFGKYWEHNRQLLLNLGKFQRIGRPILVGLSRKSFIGQITGDPPYQRGAGSLAVETLAMWFGAGIVRTHDVASAKRAAATIAALRSGAKPR